MAAFLASPSPAATHSFSPVVIKYLLINFSLARTLKSKFQLVLTFFNLALSLLELDSPTRPHYN